MMAQSDARISHKELHAEVNALFALQQVKYVTIGKSTASHRIRKLRALEALLLRSRSRIQQALARDFGKSAEEVDLIEIYPVLREIRHTTRHLKRWMRKQSVTTPMALIGSRSHIRYESKGVVLIISPWNYPINLSFIPLVSAIAAGCTVVIKPSELTRHTSQLIEDLIKELFDESEVAVVQGGIEVGSHLLTLPFHHIFFTGSPRVGKIVMDAAAKHLTSVTLELGGKSPAIVDQTAHIRRAAQRIVHTKWANAGQTCIAPDYVLVHDSIHDVFLKEIQLQITAFYPTLESYTKIVNADHFSRLCGLLEDTVQQGSELVCGGKIDIEERTISPTVLKGDFGNIRQQEIFGPLLPVVSYSELQQAIDYINQHERPLGLYIFTSNRSVERSILESTRSGGSCINHCALNFYNNELPFGGINNSGIGKSHGFEGFKAFSNARAVYRQVWPFSPVLWLHPPFTRAKRRLIAFTLKWL